jgi:uncharacterized protein
MLVLQIEIAQFDKDDNCLYIRLMRYEWNSAKAKANIDTHGVDFAEAATVLEDDFALTREDSDSTSEQRFVTLGSHLVVVYTYREPDIIRLISAWKANKMQRSQYEKNRR